MNKILVIMAVLMFFESSVFAADFSPTKLVISAPDYVSCKFDGSGVKIPVEITGTHASVLLIINTKDQASLISRIQNGYLGWHYVNNIDTCVYAGAPIQLEPGDNEIVWNGKDNDGNDVPEGEYTYYIWGFDNVSEKIPLCKGITPHAWSKTYIMTHDDKGNPIGNPILWAGVDYFGDITRPASQNLLDRVNRKWIIGQDPFDETLIETCISIGVCDLGYPCFDPQDHTMFFKCGLYNNGFKVLTKWKWVPNGRGELQRDWGKAGTFQYMGSWPAIWDFGPGVVSDGGEYLLLVNADLSENGTESELIYVDKSEGTEVKRYDLSEWWVDFDDNEHGGQACGGPTTLSMWGTAVVMGAHGTCINMLFDVHYEDSEEAVFWVNSNGDYTGDHNFEKMSERPWVCNDYLVGPYKYDIAIEKNGFSFFPSFDVGAVSFGLYAPDGTGLGYHAFSGETAYQKLGTTVISCESPYDGLLCSNWSVLPRDSDQRTEEQISHAKGWFWVGQDSFRGIIGNQVSVEKETPVAFAVAQNSPNPFNSTTTIGYTISDPGDVTVDIFNAAGQKVDSIVDNYMNAGSHTVTWNAQEFASGIYYYRIEHEKGTALTKKMILVK